MEISFKKAFSEKEIKQVYEYNIDVFSDSPDFKWGLEEIKKEIEEGWELFAVTLEKDIIAAIFLRFSKGTLYSKNTAVKMVFQGSGYSHKMKEFIEKEAISLKAKNIVHYCRIDNFRMYSLNENYGYRKTNNKLGPKGHVVEWLKQIK